MSLHILKGGHRTADPRLCWVPQHDPRSRAYPATAMLTAAQTKPRTKTWTPSKVNLDQGLLPWCTACATVHELAAAPVQVLPRKCTMDLAGRIYRRAQQLDQWAGENYEGTSMLAAVKAATEFYFYTGYRWCFSFADLQLAVSWLGPVLVGSPWYAGMMQVDNEGFIHATGDYVGGHAWLVLGIDCERRSFNMKNSWGEWGQGDGGTAWIGWDDMRLLQSQYTEVVIPQGRLAG